MNARKIIFVIALVGVVCFIAICAVAIYFLQAGEKKANSERTAKARQARWATKAQNDGENFEELEQVAVEQNETIQSN